MWWPPDNIVIWWPPDKKIFPAVVPAGLRNYLMYNTAVYTHVNLMATCRSDTSENGDSDRPIRPIKTAPRPRLMYVLLIIVGYCAKTDGSQCQMVSA